VTGGLKLLPSSPPVKKSSVSISAKGERETEIPNTVKVPTVSALPGNPVIVRNLVSEEALQQVPRIAPGWDKHALRAKYEAWVFVKREMPRSPDAAFLGWVKKFTKGKRP
jgi:hypothetical protein